MESKQKQNPADTAMLIRKIHHNLLLLMLSDSVTTTQANVLTAHLKLQLRKCGLGRHAVFINTAL